jgi:hypothetical protein
MPVSKMKEVKNNGSETSVEGKTATTKNEQMERKLTSKGNFR